MYAKLSTTSTFTNYYFNGSSQWLSAANNTAFNLPGDFTIEHWVNFPIVANTTTSGSLYFNGSNYANVAAGTTALAFGTGDFTIEFYAYITANGVVYDQRTSSADVAPLINAASGSWTLQSAASTLITGAAVTQNVWTHVAVTRQSASTKLWINGTQSGSTYADTNNYICPSGRPYLGAYGDTAGAKMTGYITQLRCVKGTAVYTATFTPPTAPVNNY